MSKNNLYMLIMGIITAASVIALIVVLATGGNQTSADGSSVIATVNGEEITKNEVYDAMFSQPAGGGQSYGDQTLEQLINEVLVDQEAGSKI